MNKRKIPIKSFKNKSDLLTIFKNRLDNFGYSTWKELTDKLKMDNPRAFIDFFNGKQALNKHDLEFAFELLEIPIELLELYTEPVIKYRIKKY